jgi:hypothetical protein
MSFSRPFQAYLNSFWLSFKFWHLDLNETKQIFVGHQSNIKLVEVNTITSKELLFDFSFVFDETTSNQNNYGIQVILKFYDTFFKFYVIKL